MNDHVHTSSLTRFTAVRRHQGVLCEQNNRHAGLIGWRRSFLDSVDRRLAGPDLKSNTELSPSVQAQKLIDRVSWAHDLVSYTRSYRMASDFYAFACWNV